MAIPDEHLWSGQYKIPWQEPGFSERMLSEHLSQAHDLASRRLEWIERQVAWIHSHLLAHKPSRILDLGCGPGLYATRLAACGHSVTGLDFGPASIAYAQAHNTAPDRCRFELADIRRAAFCGPFDLVLVLYGELNVFAPSETANILRKARAALTPDGVLAVELQTPSTIEMIGRGATTTEHHKAGLFSERPHMCRTENQWFADVGVAVQTFEITDAATGDTATYRSTTQAWSKAEVIGLLANAGFVDGRVEASWPNSSKMFELWAAKRGELSGS